MNSTIILIWFYNIFNDLTRTRLVILVTTLFCFSDMNFIKILYYVLPGIKYMHMYIKTL